MLCATERPAKASVIVKEYIMTMFERKLSSQRKGCVKLRYVRLKGYLKSLKQKASMRRI